MYDVSVIFTIKYSSFSETKRELDRVYNHILEGSKSTWFLFEEWIWLIIPEEGVGLEVWSYNMESSS